MYLCLLNYAYLRNSGRFGSEQNKFKMLQTMFNAKSTPRRFKIDLKSVMSSIPLCDWKQKTLVIAFVS